MTNRLMIAAVLALPPGSGVACSCPLDTQSWWDDSVNVALVQVTHVQFGRVDFVTGRNCGDPDDCEEQQVAKFRLVELFKGSFTGYDTLSSGYAGGDCGIPLVAGAYYIAFLSERAAGVGFCNAAGPYAPRDVEADAPRLINEFVESLRKAKSSGTAVGKRPKPMPFDSLGDI